MKPLKVVICDSWWLEEEDYKEDLKKTLEELARKVEKTVKKTGKSVTLEPMNAYERKILHRQYYF